MLVQTKNSWVNPRNVERAIKNGGSYEHTVSRLIGDGIGGEIVDCEAVTTIESYNTATTTVIEPNGAMATYHTVFVRRAYAVYDAETNDLLGMFAKEQDAKEALFGHCSVGRFVYTQVIWA